MQWINRASDVKSVSTGRELDSELYIVIRYDKRFALKNLQASGQFNLMAALRGW